MPVISTQPQSEAAASRRRQPLMRSGDRLTQPEFHRLYKQMPGVRAELIDGIVYIDGSDQMASPVFRPHAEYHSLLTTWTGNYAGRVPWLTSLDNATFIASLDNEVQPDAAVVVAPSNGGSSSTNEEGCQVGVAELFIEVASSSISRDLHAKMDLYRREGVTEYVVLDIRGERLMWFELRDDRYEQRETDDGVIRSLQFPGLWLAADAFFPIDVPRVLDTLAEGMATPEFAAYLASGRHR